MGDVLEFPQEDTETEPTDTEDDFPMHLFGYITAVADGVFGDDIGFHATPAKSDDGRNLVVMIVGSLKHETIMRKAIFDLTSTDEVRKACTLLAYEIYLLEEQFDKNSPSKLLVPDKKIIIPGQ